MHGPSEGREFDPHPGQIVLPRACGKMATIRVRVTISPKYTLPQRLAVVFNCVIFAPIW